MVRLVTELGQLMVRWWWVTLIVFILLQIVFFVAGYYSHISPARPLPNLSPTKDEDDA